MDWKNARSVESTITRLEREIHQIDVDFYALNETKDRVLYAGMLERKRDDMVRSAVLQLHTSIEDLLNSQIIWVVLGVKADQRHSRMRSRRAVALRRMLYGSGSLGFDMKLNFAVAIGLMQTNTKEKLIELNTLRNRCSHNWLLKTPVRRGKRPKQKKPPLLQFRGRDLHHVAVLKEFTAEFGRIYFRMFGKLHLGL